MVATHRTAARRSQSISLKAQRRRRAYLLVAPAVVLIALMMIYPIVQTIYFSFSKVQLPALRTTFVGFDNFVRILNNPETGPLVRRTLVWIAGSVALKMTLGLVAALVFNAKVRGTVWMRVLVILPWAIPSVVGANLWRWIVQTDAGVLNQTLRSWGLESWALNWLGDPSTAMFTVIVAYSWGGFAFVMLLILARLQGLPEDINEAARVDGANWWQIFRYITLPSLSGVLAVALILEIVSGMNSFDTLMIMTGGGPANATRIWGIDIYKTGFTEFNLGGAAAQSVLMFAAVIVVFSVYGGVNSRIARRQGEAA
ncbi:MULTISPECIES: sugar ABC transporter permease [unclassified Chelatococcus]|uniref:carbohydrate ABC transporter permease n=1 Tax=unclassified Chelatococcus TaxID=2638111 RepID=UPI001BCB5319|nr:MULTISPECIES: sugar ABC transporter permease [unclassified Chelatococcus]MBS7700760.1 sugar ABC transporter permease [Chelatococcus sp. YT9]MBX3559344.1 sugar ABC transporter permease [Chelatococcus sp.]